MKILKIDKDSVQVECSFEEIKIFGHSIACQIDHLDKAGFPYDSKPWRDCLRSVEQIEDKIIEFKKGRKKKHKVEMNLHKR